MARSILLARISAAIGLFRKSNDVWRYRSKANAFPRWYRSSRQPRVIDLTGEDDIIPEIRVKREERERLVIAASLPPGSQSRPHPYSNKRVARSSSTSSLSSFGSMETSSRPKSVLPSNQHTRERSHKRGTSSKRPRLTFDPNYGHPPSSSLPSASKSNATSTPNKRPLWKDDERRVLLEYLKTHPEPTGDDILDWMNRNPVCIFTLRSLSVC